MNTSFPWGHTARTLSVLLVAAIVLACDATDPQNDDRREVTGRWTATVPADWTTTYPLPDGASADSVRYEHVGVHTFAFDLEQTGETISGTVDWDIEGTFVVSTYDGTSLTVEVDTLNRDDAPASAQGTLSGAQLTFTSGKNLGWIYNNDPVELTLTQGELRGQIPYPYLSQSWVIEGQGQVETRFEVPLSVRLTPVPN